MTRALISANVLAFAALLALTSTNARAADQATGGDSAGASQAVTPEILEAVATEIERAMVMLNIPGEPKPYFIGHKLTEVDVNDVVAGLGSTTAKRNRHFVLLEARVHVGDYAFDNSNFVIPNAEGTDGISQITLPLEATPRIARRAAWLVTDAAYKEAIEQMRAKQDARRTGGGTGDERPSYSREEPRVEEEPVEVPALETLEFMEQRAQTVSRAFRPKTHLRDSRVAFTSFLERRWYLNSEGTNVHDTRRVSGVIVAATSQAEDGQELSLYYSRYGHTAADLPGEKELLREAENLSKTLRQLQSAPLMDNYTGPVLFEGVGAAGVVRNTLTPHLGGTPLPEGLAASEAKQLGGALSGRIGLRALSPTLTVIDDPSTHRAGKRALIGGYGFDDEGVPAQRVKVIENGNLVSLLHSRTPAQPDGKSNGHARRTPSGGVFHGSATNVFLQARRGLPRARLRRKLLSEAREQGLPYALIIRQFDDPAVTASPESTKRELLHLLTTTDPEQPPVALLAYKLYPNGREELVRGAQLRPIDMRAWRDVVAVGTSTTVFNFLASGVHNLVSKLNGIGDGDVPSSGIESAIVTPDLLFRELDVTTSTVGRRSAPLIPAPR